ncbi:o-succinylbenzoate--CoA ligase [Rahnella sp. C60]|uniref:o-succinylbenzoate--CoA ligase n=2 Tax=Rahnella perminowiae TaxID=2816244 RepID=UPI001C27B160|nr:o-succinylbenzoate--CoA ligase [Rahnella perminowiae]MBU9815778.1 o-succinylbenzoate--CoA ligase [Rahnella perminowiae]
MAEQMINDWPWRERANLSPFAVALKAGDITWCWRDLQHRIDTLAAGFMAQGVGEGAGVVLRSKNTLDAVLSYLALLQTGARLLPLNPQLPQALCDELLSQLDIAFMLDLAEPGLLLNIPALTLQNACWISSAGWQPQRIATLTLTSGSSGLPKAAAHTVAAHLASAAGVLKVIPFTCNDSWLLSLPLFHVSGQGILWRWLTAGATLVLTEGQPFEVALASCSHASLVPTQLWRLLQGTAVPEKLKDVLLGGAQIPPELTGQAESAGIRCWCGYGLTETASTVTAKRADGRAGVGQALAGKEVKIADQEILIRTDSLASGYWKNGQLSPVADAGGWLHTRDRGEWRDGELLIAGRLDNLFFSGGEGIQPEDIEKVLVSHPQVLQAFVVPVEDEQFGQRPVAVLDAQAGLRYEELNLWLSNKIPRFQWPVAYYPLPVALSQGGIKISRASVRRWIEMLS